MLWALWSCGRRVSVVQAKRQIPRAYSADDLESFLSLFGYLPEFRYAEYHVDRILTTPLFQSTLQGSQLPIRIVPWMRGLQAFEEFARGEPRLSLEPLPELGRDRHKRIWPSPLAHRFRFGDAGRAHLSGVPCGTKAGEKFLQARCCWRRRRLGRRRIRDFHELLLSRPDLPQQVDRIKLGLLPAGCAPRRLSVHRTTAGRRASPGGGTAS